MANENTVDAAQALVQINEPEKVYYAPREEETWTVHSSC